MGLSQITTSIEAAIGCVVSGGTLGVGGFQGEFKHYPTKKYTQILTRFEELKVFVLTQPEKTTRTLLGWCELHEAYKKESAPRCITIRVSEAYIQPSSASPVSVNEPGSMQTATTSLKSTHEPVQEVRVESRSVREFGHPHSVFAPFRITFQTHYEGP